YLGRMGAESPELRVLRMAEIEMFSPDPVASAVNPLPVDPADQDCTDSSCSEPADERRRSTYFQEGDGSDFLDRLQKPELPVAARPELEKYVEYFSSDPKGRSMFAAWLRSAGKYDPIVTQAFAKRKLP